MKKLKQLGLGLGIFLGALFAYGALTEPDRAQIPVRNMLSNPGAENGKATVLISAGTLTLTTTASNVGSGAQAWSWATGGSSRNFTLGGTIPAGLYGRAGVASCLIKGATADHILKAFDGTNTISSTTTPHTTTYSRVSTNFTFPSSGNMFIRLTSASSETLFIDDCYLGSADGINLGSTPIATDWNSDLTFTPNATAFGTVTLSDFKYKREGDTAHVIAYFKSGTLTGNPAKIALPSGLTIDTGKTTLLKKYKAGSWTRHASGASVGISVINQSGDVFVDASDSSNVYLAGNTASDAYTSDNANTIGNNNDGFTLNFYIPITQWGSSGVTYRPDQVANSWSGYHGTNCSWSVTNTSYADPSADTTCTFTERVNKNFGTVTSANTGSAGDNLPGIVFTPTRSGTYKVCANILAGRNTTSEQATFKLTDGTTEVSTVAYYSNVSGLSNRSEALCGLYAAASTSPVTLKIQMKATGGDAHIDSNAQSNAIEWSLYQIDQNLPAPLISNSVVSSSSGVESVNRVTFGTTNATTDCTSSPCSYVNQSGSWLSSVSRTSTGLYVLNISAGTYSGAPTCTCSTFNNGTVCSIDTLVTPSSTSVGIRTTTVGGTLIDVVGMAICMGPK